MAFGLGVLRLDSAAFWSLTPRELASAHEGVFGAPPKAMARGVLNALMRDFPDGAHE
jgi:uncharacterized phage protein (TIGR02216 family)